MAIIIHSEQITPEIAAQLQAVCPFGALDYENGTLSVNAGCKSCKLCVKKGPAGVVEWQEEQKAASVDKSAWRGVAVFGQLRDGGLHPVSLELLGKARELAAVTGEPVYALLIGKNMVEPARTMVEYGADLVCVYDHAELEHFNAAAYANAFYDFIQQLKPGSILVGATNLGRSLAPRVAAMCGTGLTADCTKLEMRENTDLVQIRPAFGGNVMAQIITPDARPQFATVRYKIFSAPEKQEQPTGQIRNMEVTAEMITTGTRILEVIDKPKVVDISEADVIVACGRGFRTQADLAMAEELASLLGAQMACTRPLIEAGWMDPRRQIGLSGRTVKPRLILALGISGSVQFAAGMKGADRIVAVNTDPAANIFDIAHVGIVGDLYEILPQLLEQAKGGQADV